MARAPKKDPRLTLLGIRHHGPGSARATLRALDAADPAVVLIEGPPDANDMIPYAANKAMVPPVALLVYGIDDASNALYFPFAEYSPEWQAMRWAVERGRPVRFIDLPATHKLAIAKEAHDAAKEAAEAAAAMAASEPEMTSEEEGESEGEESVTTTEIETSPADDTGTAPEGEPAGEDAIAKHIRRDPLAYLAEIAGYEDSEAWWNALIEQSGHAPPVFDAIESAMAALREAIDPLDTMSADDMRLELQREAHMRLELAKALKETDGQVAVVCGAWHVPALRAKVAAKDDRALLKGLPKLKVTATWVPWTDTRLAASSGYGAGVTSPRWYGHVWRELSQRQASMSDDQASSAAGLSPREFTARWQARVAELLREKGKPASTANVIEASRLAEALASMRELALPGLDELREAGLATLCDGEPAVWRLIEQKLVIGEAVGEIADDVPQMPLLADLTRQQKRLKLKPEALDKEVSLDLRSDAGLGKSLLLHRLLLINVPWGRQTGSGSSRGTFRENWVVRWDPEFSVRLVEALVHGTTVEQASGNAAAVNAKAAKSIGDISEIVSGCLNAGLESAANQTISILQAEATRTTDIGELAQAIPPLVTVLRYGTARAMPTAALERLVKSLSEGVSASLNYGCRSLQYDAAAELRKCLDDLNSALALMDDDALTSEWRRALRRLADDTQAVALLRGFAVRALYDASVFNEDDAAQYMSRALSRSVDPREAGDWLEGFLAGQGGMLVHDHALLAVIDDWLGSVSEDDFVPLLPMLCRAMGSIDRTERRLLLDAVQSSPSAQVAAASQPAGGADNAPGFAAAVPLLLTILGAPTDQTVAAEAHDQVEEPAQ